MMITTCVEFNIYLLQVLLVMCLQEVHIYTYISTTCHYVVIGHMPASRKDLLVVCLVSVCTTHYTYKGIIIPSWS